MDVVFNPAECNIDEVMHLVKEILDLVYKILEEDAELEDVIMAMGVALKALIEADRHQGQYIN